MHKRPAAHRNKRSIAAEASRFYAELRPPKDSPDEQKAKAEAIARFLAEKAKGKGGS